MRSRASFKGHPIHPALIPFPFAFLNGALLFDLAGWALGNASFTSTAGHLAIAGIGFGLLAAVPGIIDYLYSVPPNSSGRKRATLHARLNATALVLFGAAVWLRGDDYAGWLGGTLVNRNMIGVDHRYADAGKWKEETVAASDGTIVAAREDELKPGQMKLLHFGNRRIVLGRTSDGYVAFDDRCTHRGASLAGGVLVDGTVQCLWHGSQFNVATGQVRCGPAQKGIATYAVHTRDGQVVIAAPTSAALR
jgi:nitrite reductase/ring-hydroxylating ferredoxin subunit